MRLVLSRLSDRRMSLPKTSSGHGLFVKPSHNQMAHHGSTRQPQIFGGTPQQIEYAAEMGLEHHFGLTCDPVAGLAQIYRKEGVAKSVVARAVSL